MKKKFLTNGWAYIFLLCLTSLILILSIIVLIITKNTLHPTSYIYCIILFLIVDILFILLCIFTFCTISIDENGIKVYHLFKCVNIMNWTEIKCIEVATNLYKYIYITTDNRSLNEKLNSISLKDSKFISLVYNEKI